MAGERENEIKEAVETVAEAAGANVALADALEAAEERQEELEEAAEDIAAAAMEAERARRIQALEEEFNTWRNDLSARIETLTTEMAETTRRLSELAAQVNTPPVVTVTQEPATDQPLIPTPLPDVPKETVVTVNPGAVAGDLAAAVPENPAKRPIRWL